MNGAVPVRDKGDERAQDAVPFQPEPRKPVADMPCASLQESSRFHRRLHAFKLSAMIKGDFVCAAKFYGAMQVLLFMGETEDDRKMLDNSTIRQLAGQAGVNMLVLVCPLKLHADPVDPTKNNARKTGAPILFTTGDKYAVTADYGCVDIFICSAGANCSPIFRSILNNAVHVLFVSIIGTPARQASVPRPGKRRARIDM